MNNIKKDIEALQDELSFWLDFVRWWEHKNGRPAEPRILAVIADLKRRSAEASADGKQVERRDSGSIGSGLRN
jgi:hypothetical protein